MFCSFKLQAADGASQLQDTSSAESFKFVNAAVSLQLKKRISYPQSYAQDNRDILTFGYGQENETIDWLLAAYDQRTHRFTLQRDGLCTLPLFCYVTDDICLISDDVAWIIRELGEVHINRQALGSLLLRPEPGLETLFAGISLLDADSSLAWQPGKHSLTVPHTTVAGQETEPNPREFKTRLEETLLKYWRQASDSVTAFEVSGGIDSATMPLFIAHSQRPENMLIGNMLFPGDFQTTQTVKLQDVIGQTSGSLVQVPVRAENDFPLARYFVPEFKPEMSYQYQEIYTEPLSALANDLAVQGVDTVFTGIGGDELFENIIELPHEPASEPTPAWVLPAGRELLAPPSRDKLLSYRSAFFSGQSRNKVYIDAGIWPISPLADPELKAYTSQLGITYRANKNILRAYHQAMRFPESVYRPVQNEHFAHFFDISVTKRYGEVLPAIRKNSLLEQKGYINTDTLQKRYEAARQQADGGDELFAVFRTVSAEVILQAASDELGRQLFFD